MSNVQQNQLQPSVNRHDYFMHQPGIHHEREQKPTSINDAAQVAVSFPIPDHITPGCQNYTQVPASNQTLQSYPNTMPFKDSNHSTMNVP